MTTPARGLEIFRRRLSPVRDFLVLDDLTVIQSRETGLLHRQDMDENVPTAVLRLNKPVPLLTV